MLLPHVYDSKKWGTYEKLTGNLEHVHHWAGMRTKQTEAP